MIQKTAEWTTAYIGMGSNLNDPIEQITQARDAISQGESSREIAFSSLYQSIPMGPSDQPDYVNAVMAIETKAAPLDLLHFLQQIEDQQGRVRIGERWGPRALDLDILLYGEDIIETAQLTVPHYGLSERAFVLYPLYEICPGLEIPNRGSLKKLIESCPGNGLTTIQ